MHADSAGVQVLCIRVCRRAYWHHRTGREIDADTYHVIWIYVCLLQDIGDSLLECTNVIIRILKSPFGFETDWLTL